MYTTILNVVDTNFHAVLIEIFEEVTTFGCFNQRIAVTDSHFAGISILHDVLHILVMEVIVYVKEVVEFVDSHYQIP